MRGTSLASLHPPPRYPPSPPPQRRLCEALLEGGRRLGGARGVRGDGNRLLAWRKVRGGSAARVEAAARLRPRVACPHDRAPHLVVPLQHGAQRQPAPPDQRVEGEVCEGCLRRGGCRAGSGRERRERERERERE